MNQYTDNQLKSALAKLLPDKIENCCRNPDCNDFYWNTITNIHKVKDTELLHLCHLAERKLESFNEYAALLQSECGPISAIIALWQQRVVALCKVKGVEI